MDRGLLRAPIIQDLRPLEDFGQDGVTCYDLHFGKRAPLLASDGLLTIVCALKSMM